MPDILAISIFLLIFTIGEYVAVKTKANVDVVLFVAAVLLVGFWLGLPSSIYEASGLLPIAGNVIVILIVGMGNLIDFDELVRQWKTVVVSCLSLTVACFLLVGVGQFIIGKDLVLAGAPVFGGGTTATLALRAVLEEKGREDLIVFIVLLLGLQSFVGIPASSQLLKRAAKAFKANEKDYNLYAATLETTLNAGEKKRLIKFPKSLDRPSFHLARLAIVGAVSYYLSAATGGRVNYIILALVMGTVATEIGFLDRDALNKSESSGFILFACVLILFADFATTSPSQVAHLLVPMLVVLCGGTLMGCICGFFCGKIFKIEPNLAMVMCLTCMYGFPATMYLSVEVAEAVADNEEQAHIIENYLLPKMNVAGFITGSFAVVLAGIFGGML